MTLPSFDIFSYVYVRTMWAKGSLKKAWTSVPLWRVIAHRIADRSIRLTIFKIPPSPRYKFLSLGQRFIITPKLIQKRLSPGADGETLVSRVDMPAQANFVTCVHTATRKSFFKNKTPRHTNEACP